MRTHGTTDGAVMTVQGTAGAATDPAPGADGTAPAVDVRAAAVAWEELFRAQVAIMRRLQRDPIWDRLTLREYDVLFTLSRAPEGLRLRDLGELSLLSQPSLSRMVEQLEALTDVAGALRAAQPAIPDLDRRGDAAGHAAAEGTP